MFVLTVDQRSSTTSGDKVPDILRGLQRVLVRDLAPAVSFTRTVGDEIQGVLTTPVQVYAATRFLLRQQNWYVGVGIGSVDTPLPKRSSEGSGEAFVCARKAVDDAKVQRGSVPVSVRTRVNSKAAKQSAEEIQALMRLLGVVLRSRSQAAWEAIDLLTHADGAPTGFTQRDVAAQLGISTAAVSKRLKAASLDEELALIPLLVRLLAELDQSVTF